MVTGEDQKIAQSNQVTTCKPSPKSQIWIQILADKQV